MSDLDRCAERTMALLIESYRFHAITDRYSLWARTLEGQRHIRWMRADLTRLKADSDTVMGHLQMLQAVIPVLERLQRFQETLQDYSLICNTARYGDGTIGDMEMHESEAEALCARLTDIQLGDVIDGMRHLEKDWQEQVAGLEQAIAQVREYLSRATEIHRYAACDALIGTHREGGNDA